MQRLVDPLSHRLGTQLLQQTIFDAQAGEPLVPIDRHFDGLGFVGGAEGSVVHLIERPV
ncbi:Uncharacterised protein [Mycobacterium tuberculosis]|uniref:Uncharacterized protein n=1 Tax=Mycobacterium tuberculosis TaxID=1773 RepID=A0A916PCQ6_MYCTX|nr:Uncharacterised protein [Mycobacterium tuberculosis]